MNVLLVYPKFPDTFWSFKHALRFIRKKAAFPPLGLLTTASLLPKDWSRRLVDMNVGDLSDADLSWANLVFIGGMTIQRESARQVIARCNAMGVKVVGGGPLFTCEPDEFKTVAHLVLDEAELTLPRFLADLEKGTPERTYRASEFCDIRTTPVPQWDLIEMKKYASMCLQFSRGCPFHCDFCNVTILFGRKPRMKTPEQMIHELETLQVAGWRGNVFFVDDNFIGNKNYLKTKLLPELIRWRKGKKGFVFYTETSINLADDPELMEMMVKAGFDTVFVGIESPDEESLTECRKNQNKNRDLLQSVKGIQRAGLQVMGGFIVGFDNDTQSTFHRQVEFIQKSGIVTAMVGMLQAPPGTRLFERLSKENRVLGALSGDNVDGTTNIIPRMGLPKLVEGYRALMEQLYSPECYYQRVRTFLKEFKTPEVRVPMDFHRFFAFFRSSVRLGIGGKERYQYWKLVLWTLTRRPKLLPLAITLAIHGYHFRRVCELHIH